MVEQANDIAESFSESIQLVDEEHPFIGKLFAQLQCFIPTLLGISHFE
jgi:hypothetical protein